MYLLTPRKRIRIRNVNSWQSLRIDSKQIDSEPLELQRINSINSCSLLSKLEQLQFYLQRSRLAWQYGLQEHFRYVNPRPRTSSKGSHYSWLFRNERYRVVDYDIIKSCNVTVKIKLWHYVFGSEREFGEVDQGSIE